MLRIIAADGFKLKSLDYGLTYFRATVIGKSKSHLGCSINEIRTVQGSAGVFSASHRCNLGRPLLRQLVGSARRSGERHSVARCRWSRSEFKAWRFR